MTPNQSLDPMAEDIDDKLREILRLIENEWDISTMEKIIYQVKQAFNTYTTNKIIEELEKIDNYIGSIPTSEHSHFISMKVKADIAELRETL